MIIIEQKTDCCGCSACEQICPKNCISLEQDKEGYWYPMVDRDVCVDCHACEQICPVINQNKESAPLKVYAAINKDEDIRSKSSSGGIFTIVAEKIIQQGGVVFGVKFDNEWNVIFGHTEIVEGLKNFRGSKYVQAWLGDTYKDVKAFLNKGRLVLFVGTPCQVAGLKRFLKRDYERLLTMDLICEGVPSPKVWKKYLKEELARQGKKNTVLSHPISENDVLIKDISFRNKSLGWKKFSFALTLAKASAEGEKNSVLPSYINRKSAYMQAMFQYLDLRPICYQCPFKSCKSHSDITIADYWGITILHPEMDDDNGTSMVYIHSVKGEKYFDLNKVWYIETNYEEAFNYNNIVTSVKIHPKRDFFFSKIDSDISIIKLMNILSFPPSYYFKLLIRRILELLFGKRITNHIRKVLGRE